MMLTSQTDLAVAQALLAQKEEIKRLRAELAEAGELLQCWLAEAPGDPETHEWLARNGFKDPYPECWERAEDDADAPAPCAPAPSVVSSSPNNDNP